MFRDDFLRSAKALGVDDVLSSARVIAVGFSGGADSTVLLSMLAECYANAEIRAIHINHMIRGEAADRDEMHCRTVCEKMGIPLAVRRIDVPAIAEEKHIGIEQAAREARYSAFDEYLCTIGTDAAYLCTAHNADDNLETLIFNLIRGSGSRGMGGISPRRGRILRPMLSITSEAIRAYANEAGLDFVVDETNADTRYTRNQIRGEVIPLLRNIAPECAHSAASTSSLVRRDDDYLNSLAKELVGGRGSVPVSELRSAHDVVLSRALLLMYSTSRGERTDFGSVHISDCVRLIRESDFGEICLPGAISMIFAEGAVHFEPTVRTREKISFERVLWKSGDALPDASDPLIVDFPEGDFRISLAKGSEVCRENFDSEENIYKKSIYATLDFDKIKGTVIARSKRAGDVILLRSMHRKLKKVLCDKKITDRDTLPVICDDEGVLFVPGIGARDGVTAKSGLLIEVRR